MAEVFLARRIGAAGFEKKLALKRLPADQLGDELLVKSLINEAMLAAQLSHPNLVQVFEFEFIEGTYCMAMEYVDGVTLEAVLQRCRSLQLPIPNGLVVFIALEILTGLDYAHSARADDGTPLNLVHRDIKPSNIMILRQGQVKIMDFGIARAATNPYKTTRSGGVKGTLAYMSPEQLSGAENLGPQSDLFSAGTVMYEMATLDRLLDDTNLILLARQLMEGLREEARQQLDTVFPELSPIVERMLQPDLEKRYENARAAITDLRSLGTGASAIELADFVADLGVGAGSGEVPGTIPSSNQHAAGKESHERTPGAMGSAGSGLATPVDVPSGFPGLPRADARAETLPSAGNVSSVAVKDLPHAGVQRTGEEAPGVAFDTHAQPDGIEAGEAAGGNVTGTPHPPSGSSGPAVAAGAGGTLAGNARVVEDDTGVRYVPPPGARALAKVAVALAVLFGIGVLGWFVLGPFSSETEVASNSGEVTGVAGLPPTPETEREPSATGAPDVSPPGSPAPLVSPHPVSPPPVASPGHLAAKSTKSTKSVSAGRSSKKPRRPGRRSSKPGARVSHAATKTSPRTAAAIPTPGVAGKTGMLTVNSVPSSKVILDGVEMDWTPLIGLVVASGRHKVQLICGNGKTKSFDVFVEPGEKITRRVWDFNKGDWMTPDDQQP